MAIETHKTFNKTNVELRGEAWAPFAVWPEEREDWEG